MHQLMQFGMLYTDTGDKPNEGSGQIRAWKMSPLNRLIRMSIY